MRWRGPVLLLPRGRARWVRRLFAWVGEPAQGSRRPGRRSQGLGALPRRMRERQGWIILRQLICLLLCSTA
ncbi:hypothetical protein B0H14DRAFT_2855983 [Mycena olivaceomarginata]|nr:hypothetical protein B0H14DRAFT_2855983 [Mycena olivaceomarginata]